MSALTKSMRSGTNRAQRATPPPPAYTLVAVLPYQVQSLPLKFLTWTHLLEQCQLPEFRRIRRILVEEEVRRQSIVYSREFIR